MFEALAEHPKILVTGPGRSGTTIAGKMIAQDTGHRYEDEGGFRGNRIDLFRDLVARESDVVVQCPLMFRVIIDNPPPDVFVVVMRRNVDDIRNSFNQVLRLMNTASNVDAGVVAQEYYDYWDGHAKPFPFLELNYDAITDHSLYVPPERRVNFGIKQTEEGGAEWPNSYNS
jgi:hypothetical protein